MYVRVEAIEGQIAPPDLYLSLRVGSTQKQSRFCEKKCFQFPDPGDARRNFGRVEIFRRIGTASVDFTECKSGELQDVSVACKDLEMPCIRIRVASSTDKRMCDEPTKPQKEQKLRQRFDEAQKYMRDHQLNDLLAETLREVIRAKPADPHEYMSSEILKRSMKLPPLPPMSTDKNPSLHQGAESVPKEFELDELRQRVLRVLTSCQENGSLQSSLELELARAKSSRQKDQTENSRAQAVDLDAVSKEASIKCDQPLRNGSSQQSFDLRDSMKANSEDDKAWAEHHSNARVNARHALESALLRLEDRTTDVKAKDWDEHHANATANARQALEAALLGVGEMTENIKAKDWDDHHANATANARQALELALLGAGEIKADVKAKDWDDHHANAAANARQALEAALLGVGNLTTDIKDKDWDEHHANAAANARQALEAALLGVGDLTADVKAKDWDEHHANAAANARQALEAALLGVGDLTADVKAKDWDEYHANATANARQALETALLGAGEMTDLKAKEWNEHHADTVNARHALEMSLICNQSNKLAGDRKRPSKLQPIAEEAQLESARNIAEDVKSIVDEGQLQVAFEYARDALEAALMSDQGKQLPENTPAKTWDEEHANATVNARQALEAALLIKPEDVADNTWDEHHAAARSNAHQALQAALLGCHDKHQVTGSKTKACEANSLQDSAAPLEVVHSEEDPDRTFANGAKKQLAIASSGALSKEEDRATAKFVCSSLFDGALLRLRQREDPEREHCPVLAPMSEEEMVASMRKRTAHALLDALSNGKLEEALAEEMAGPSIDSQAGDVFSSLPSLVSRQASLEECKQQSDSNKIRLLAIALKDALQDDALPKLEETRSSDRTTDGADGKHVIDSYSSSDRGKQTSGSRLHAKDSFAQDAIDGNIEMHGQVILDPVIRMSDVAELIDAKIDSRLDKVTKTISQDFDEKINRLISSLHLSAVSPNAKPGLA